MKKQYLIFCKYKSAKTDIQTVKPFWVMETTRLVLINGTFDDACAGLKEDILDDDGNAYDFIFQNLTLEF